MTLLACLIRKLSRPEAISMHDLRRALEALRDDGDVFLQLLA